MQHKMLVNDYNSAFPHPTQNHSGGVMTILRSDFPGYTTAEELTERSIRNRYLVLRLLINDAPVYIPYVYAPVKAEERVGFYELLLSNTFESTATHIVSGDFNTSLDPAIGASSGTIRHEPSRLTCLEWISQLGVVDAWRIQHLTENVFTGPLPRKNRLDYICMSEELLNMVYKTSEYFRPRHAGDHLAQKVTFANPTQSPGRGYWKCSLRLFEYPKVVEAIKLEAILVLEQLRTTSNPGKMWESWKTKIKKQLQSIEKKVAKDSRRDVESSQRALKVAVAAARYRIQDTNESRYFYESSLEQFKISIENNAKYNQDESFGHHVKHMENSSKHFFHPPDSSCRPVPIENVTKKCGTVTSNPREIIDEFRDHWGGVMGSLYSSETTQMFQVKESKKSYSVRFKFPLPQQSETVSQLPYSLHM